MTTVALPPDADAYPALLRRIKGDQPTLYVRGDVAALGLPGVAVVGTRKASPPGLSAAFAIGERLALLGFSVISGLALGIDGQAHRGVLAGGGRTVAVLSHGLDRVYPAEHKALADDVVTAHGALVSEHPDGVRPSKPGLVRRNRIIAGLARALVLVESDVDGGAMHAVRFAVEAKVPVFAVWSTQTGFLYAGAQLARRKHGATLVRSVNALALELASVPRKGV